MTTHQSPDTPEKCAKCGSTSVAEIRYGLLPMDEELESEIEGGLVVLGGCCIDPSSPSWHCNRCRHEWGSIELEPDVEE